MTCNTCEDTLLDMARGVPVEAGASTALSRHLETCEACRLRLARERALSAGLREVARATRHEEPSAMLEQQLLQAFSVAHPPVPAAMRTARGWRNWMAAAAAIVVVAAGLTAVRLTDRGGGAAQPPEVVAESEFVPWPGAAALPAFESGELVRTELPVSALPVLGLTPAGNATGSTVMADVLVGQDGLARAVRLARF